MKNFSNPPMAAQNGLLDISGMSVYEVLEGSARFRPRGPAYTYFGCTTDYSGFLRQVDLVASCFIGLGVGKGDRVMVCLPNCPQALISFYALNRIGAVSVMVHPLSSPSEIRHYMEDSGSVAAITLWKLVDNFPSVAEGDVLKTLIATSPVDALPSFKAALAKLFNKEVRASKAAGVLSWKQFISRNGHVASYPKISPDDPATILYTGGTTGTNKGAVHSNRSLNASAMGMVDASGIRDSVGMKVLGNLPMFHGFGLCTCIHIPVYKAIECVLMPTFSVRQVCDTIVTNKVNYIVGVPSLFSKMVDHSRLEGEDLSFIEGVFCGGDAISLESKKRVDSFLKDHGSNALLRVGYGSTELLAAVTLTDGHEEVSGCCGLPILGYSVKTVEQGTTREAPMGDLGEICVTGPSMMLGYIGNEEETSKIFKRHGDGKIWFHTGDVGSVDGKGRLIFASRIKRVVVTSGYNVYPSQIEDILDGDIHVKESCVIGVPDSQRGERVVAYVVLNSGVPCTDEVEEAISRRVENNIASYARPREYRFLDSMPKTKLQKIDYRKLEEDYEARPGRNLGQVEPRRYCLPIITSKTIVN